MAGANEYRSAIVEIFPQLAHAKFSVIAAGHDSLAVDVDDTYVFKFPRTPAAAARLRNEAQLLRLIQPEISMQVPVLSLHEGPPLFSSHRKIKGTYLLTDCYRALSQKQRSRLAIDLARFYAELHGLGLRTVHAAGAGRLEPWPDAEKMHAIAFALVPDHLRNFAHETIDAWRGLGEDPLGAVYGFFDGHGWNLAFDQKHGKLNGIYDFADSGIGPLHQDFIYSSFIDEDLTLRIMDGYEALTGKVIDRRRVETLTGIHRLLELSGSADQPEHLALMRSNLENWATRPRAA